MQLPVTRDLGSSHLEVEATYHQGFPISNRNEPEFSVGIGEFSRKLDFRPSWQTKSGQRFFCPHRGCRLFCDVCRSGM